MKTNKKIKNLLCCMVAFIVAVFANFAFIKLNAPAFKVSAATNNNSLPIKVSNANFSENVASTYPFEPKYYTATSENTYVDAGVINVEDNKYASRFNNLKPLSVSDSYVLMIDGGDAVVDYGFTTTDSIKLSKGGIYLVSVDVYTAEGGTAYLSLERNGEEFDSIANIVSKEDFTTYYFFVKTSNVEDVNVKLGMHLKGTGVAMFDNICAAQINNNELLSYSSLSSSRVSLTNKVTHATEFDIRNLSFSHIDFEGAKENTSTAIVKDTDGNQAYAYKITNTERTYFEAETVSFGSGINSIEFEQNAVYKVTINAKTENLDGKAILKLAQIVEDDETSNDATLEISSNTASKGNILNDYKSYSFYVKSSPIETTNYKLSVALGTEGAKTLGSISISSINVAKITNSIYTSASEGSEVKKIDLTKSSVLTSSTTALDNAKFDTVEIDSLEKPYPASPASWDVTVGSTSTQAHGVVNTSDVEFAKLSGLDNLSNPNDTRNSGTKANNNVLMLHNAEADTLAYTSTTKNLSAKTIHKFQALVQSQNAPVTLELVTKKDNKDVVLSSISLDTDYMWEKVEMYVKVGYQPLDVALRVKLESDSWAYAYVDDTRFDYSTQPSEETFNSIQPSLNLAKVDLTNLITADYSAKFEQSNLFSATGEYAISGLLHVRNGEITEEAFLETSADNVIGIRALTETNYKLTSNLGFKLTAGEDKYYKISVDVYTQYLQMLAEDADEEKMGAGIKLTSFDETFTSVVSDKVWTTYTFYISPDADTTTYIELLFGSEDAKITGDAFFGNITFTENVSKTEFNGASNSDTTKVLKKTVVQDTTTEDDKTEENKDDKASKTNWLYFASSLIFAAALVVGVLGVMIKKIKWKKPSKKAKNTYDRNRTVSKQYYMRKATTLREAKVRELEKDLQELANERIKFEEEYKADLARLRQLKIKRASASEIKCLEKDMKKNQKLSASIGVTINRIQDDIDYAKTDAYLNALVRRLASQKEENEETENN